MSKSRSVSFCTGTYRLPSAGIDPAQAVLLPLIAIPQPAGVGSLNLSIPNVQAFVGSSLYAQALFVPLQQQARLGNVVHDVVQ